MAKGMIFEIKEFAIHDGPGIRTTVFLKGCPLRCVWCHNPEGLSFQKELIVNTTLCTRCGDCQAVCRYDAAPFAFANCMLCGECLNVCPFNLRKVCGREISAAELADILKQDADFLEKNYGGITISGGEPLAQPEFVAELIRGLAPLHVTVDTSGYAPPEIFQEIVQLVNLVLFDIKHTDPEIHRSITGVENAGILKNLVTLCSGDTPFIVRIPLIPTVNDSRSNLENIARMIAGVKHLIRVDILPYHKTAGAKYSMVGQQYSPTFPVDAVPRIFQDVFQAHNIRSVIL